MTHTPGPWFVGHWGGRCNKPEHAGMHPGLNGPNPCVYEPVRYDGDVIIGIASENGQSVVTSDYNGVVISEANARLIAAAPELLEALYEAEEYFDNRADADHDETGFVPNTEMKLLVSIRAAIAKATGADK